MDSDVELKNVHFNPSESVTFDAEPRKQEIPIEIQNNESMDLLVKFKSTRSGIFNTLPTFAIVKAGNSMKFELICEGIDREKVSRDRFSIIVSGIKPTVLAAKQIWKNYKNREELLIGKIHKKMIFIKFSGINETDWWNKSIFGEPETKIPTFVIQPQQSDDPLSEDMKTTLIAGKYTCLLVPLE
ncbi:Major sperm protein [Caenorhabditis elegans]|uniref:Major sperm protein n=1 Tax=Caenorhabditis elegans TaxID=6239 RepID=Q95XR9_CAEEL|nr:Major sperm protein [Caenorhabditis elegans]CCD67385.1 Major sperm protein [Caenorhabditis elegans]|eukprot:NP_500200.1 Major sperm protein [Caenorhabditis elegans]